MQVFLASASDPSPTKDGVVVGTSSSINAGYAFGYSLTLTVPKGVQPAHDSQLYVLEWYSTGNGGPTYRTTTAAVPVEF
jgi:hypothetical protein